VNIFRTIIKVIIICMDTHIVSCRASAHIGLSLNAPGYFSLTITLPSADDSMCSPWWNDVSSNRCSSIGSM